MAFADCATITLKGILMDCSSSIGGIKRVWLTRYSDLAGQPTVGDITETDPETSEVITLGKGITAINLKSGAEWYEYQFRKNTGSLTSTLNVDTENGNNYITSELSLVFSKMETKKRMEMAALTVGAVVAVVEDSNGKFWYLGYDDYVSASAGTGETGTAKEDRNAYTITLSTDSTEWPYELSAAAAASVTG
jgi:hypothetical protein